MTIYSHLHREHDAIKKALNKITAFGKEDSAEKSLSFDELKIMLLTHAKAEEDAFYDKLKALPELQDKIKQSQEEHNEAESLLEELSQEHLAGADWQQKFLLLKDNIEHHIQEEEDNIFKLAKSLAGAKKEYIDEINSLFLKQLEVYD